MGVNHHGRPFNHRLDGFRQWRVRPQKPTKPEGKEEGRYLHPHHIEETEHYGNGGQAQGCTPLNTKLSSSPRSNHPCENCRTKTPQASPPFCASHLRSSVPVTRDRATYSADRPACRSARPVAFAKDIWGTTNQKNGPAPREVGGAGPNRVNLGREVTTAQREPC